MTEKQVREQLPTILKELRATKEIDQAQLRVLPNSVKESLSF